MATLLRLRIGAGAVLLLLHERAERLFIDAQSLLGGHLKGEINREAIRVMQREGLITADDRAARLLGARYSRIENRRALREGAAERIFLSPCNTRDARETFVKRRVGGSHRLIARIEERDEGWILDAKESHRPH